MKDKLDKWVQGNTLDINGIYYEVETEHGRDLHLLKLVKAQFPYWVSLERPEPHQGNSITAHREWCMQNCSHLWFSPLAFWWGFHFWVGGKALFMFANDADMVHFKLVWGGEPYDPNIATYPV